MNKLQVVGPLDGHLEGGAIFEASASTRWQGGDPHCPERQPDHMHRATKPVPAVIGHVTRLFPLATRFTRWLRPALPNAYNFWPLSGATLWDYFWATYSPLSLLKWLSRSLLRLYKLLCLLHLTFLTRSLLSGGILER